MRCLLCKKTEATVHITTLSEGDYTEQDYCQACAHLSEARNRSKGKPLLRCPDCGISLPEIQERGRFGCPKDYQVFEQAIIKTLDHYHGSTQHRGKIPEEEFF